jgi:hypothetical protein
MTLGHLGQFSEIRCDWRSHKVLSYSVCMQLSYTPSQIHICKIFSCLEYFGYLGTLSTHTHTHTHTHAHANTHTRICTRTCTCTRKHRCTRKRRCTCATIHACVYSAFKHTVPVLHLPNFLVHGVFWGYLGTFGFFCLPFLPSLCEDVIAWKKQGFPKSVL